MGYIRFRYCCASLGYDQLSFAQCEMERSGFHVKKLSRAGG